MNIILFLQDVCLHSKQMGLQLSEGTGKSVREQTGIVDFGLFIGFVWNTMKKQRWKQALSNLNNNNI